MPSSAGWPVLSSIPGWITVRDTLVRCAILVGDLDSAHTRRWAGALVDADLDVVAVGFGDATDFPGSVRARCEVLSRHRYATALRAVRTVIREVRPDVVHAHFVSSYGVLADLAAGGVPVVQFAWGSDVLWHDSRPLTGSDARGADPPPSRVRDL